MQTCKRSFSETCTFPSCTPFIRTFAIRRVLCPDQPARKKCEESTQKSTWARRGGGVYYLPKSKSKDLLLNIKFSSRLTCVFIPSLLLLLLRFLLAFLNVKYWEPKNKNHKASGPTLLPGSATRGNEMRGGRGGENTRTTSTSRYPRETYLGASRKHKWEARLEGEPTNGFLRGGGSLLDRQTCIGEAGWNLMVNGWQRRQPIERARVALLARPIRAHRKPVHVFGACALFDKGLRNSQRLLGSAGSLQASLAEPDSVGGGVKKKHKTSVAPMKTWVLICNLCTWLRTSCSSSECTCTWKSVPLTGFKPPDFGVFFFYLF